KESHIALVVQKLRIIKYPDPRLRQRCGPVERVNEQTVQLAERMIELMHEAKGVGLAAPQVGVALRLFVCQPADEAVPRVFVNPVLRMGEEETESEEGCLSIPEVSVNIRRATRCEMSAF